MMVFIQFTGMADDTVITTIILAMATGIRIPGAGRKSTIESGIENTTGSGASIIANTIDTPIAMDDMMAIRLITGVDMSGISNGDMIVDIMIAATIAALTDTSTGTATGHETETEIVDAIDTN